MFLQATTAAVAEVLVRSSYSTAFLLRALARSRAGSVDMNDKKGITACNNQLALLSSVGLQKGAPHTLRCPSEYANTSFFNNNAPTTAGCM